MHRRNVLVVCATLLAITAAAAWAAELKPITTRKTKDLVITLSSESGQWTQGNNAFVLQFTSAATTQPVDVGTVNFPDSGTRQVTVRWDGPAGKGSTKLSVPVR